MSRFPKPVSPRAAFRDLAAFMRQRSRFTDRVSADGASGYRAEPGRYHLYVSSACPWAHRTVIVRRLRKLEETIGLTCLRRS